MVFCSERRLRKLGVSILGKTKRKKGDVSRTVMPVGVEKKRARKLRVEYKSYTKRARNFKKTLGFTTVLRLRRLRDEFFCHSHIIYILK